MRYGEGFSGFQRTTGPAQFGTLALSIAEMDDYSVTFGGFNFTLPQDSLIVSPALAAMERLQSAYTAAVHLAKHAPEIIANREAARGLEQTLIAALADCLHNLAEPHDRNSKPSHKKILEGFTRYWRPTPAASSTFPRSAGGWAFRTAR